MNLVEDSTELDHVGDLLDDFARLPFARLTRKELRQVVANSPLPVLKRKLEAMCPPKANTFQDAIMQAWFAVEAAEEALSSTRSIDVEDIAAIKRALMRVHVLERDSEAYDVEQTRTARRKNLKNARAHRKRKLDPQSIEDAAKGVVKDHPEYADNKTQIARVVKKRLELEVDLRSITRLL